MARASDGWLLAVIKRLCGNPENRMPYGGTGKYEAMAASGKIRAAAACSAEYRHPPLAEIATNCGWTAEAER